MVCVDFIVAVAAGAAVLCHRVTSTFNGKTSSVIIIYINKYDGYTF